ncbi:MAG: hypothetical protein APF76_00215 [Desulfitibacter sp. BRH_c19]|nr:MAG: hypothetical protein APF76_00215 [Desulfitibacter sp. BRH_c19]
MKLKQLFKFLNKQKPTTISDLELKLLNAKKEWLEAQKICDEITDHRELDTAILKVVRAERRYMHYLELIKHITIKQG